MTTARRLAEHELAGDRERILLGERAPGAGHQDEAVGVGIVRQAEVGARLLDAARELTQMLGPRLRVPREASVGLAPEPHDFRAEAFEQTRRDERAGAVAAVDDNAEAAARDGGAIDVREREDPLDVALAGAGIVVLGAQLIVARVTHRFPAALGDGAERPPLVARQKETVVANEFQRIPLDWVVAGGDGDAAARIALLGGELDRGRRNDAEAANRTSGPPQPGAHGGLDDRTAAARVATDDHARPAPRSEPNAALQRIATSTVRLSPTTPRTPATLTMSGFTVDAYDRALSCSSS